MKLLREVSNSHVLIMGDFNYPDIDWSTCTNTSACASTVDFLLTVDDCFLSQHVQAPTRGNAVLDLIMSRYPDLVSDVQILHPLGSSDHNMILFSVHTKCDIDNNKKEIRDYNNADFDRMRTVLADTDWDDMMLGSVNDSWIRFREVLHNLVVDNVPLKVISAKTKLQKPIWMTHKAFKLVVKKRKKFTRYKDSQHPAVKAASKAAKAELRKSRRNFERKLAQNIKQDNKSFFACARSKMKSKVQVGPLTNQDGDSIDSVATMVNTFNDYFVSVFTKEDISHLPLLHQLTTVKCSDVQFTVSDVCNKLLKLRPDKAAGPDDLSPRLLLEVRLYCIPVVSTVQKKS